MIEFKLTGQIDVFHHLPTDGQVLQSLKQLGEQTMATRDAVLAKLQEVKDAHDQQERRAQAAIDKLQTTADDLQRKIDELQAQQGEVPVEVVEGLQAIVDDINNDFLPNQPAPQSVDTSNVAGGTNIGSIGEGVPTPSSDEGMTGTSDPLTNDETAVGPGVDQTDAQ